MNNNDCDQMFYQNGLDTDINQNTVRNIFQYQHQKSYEKTGRMSWMQAVKAAEHAHNGGNTSWNQQQTPPLVTSSTDIAVQQSANSVEFFKSDKICINRLGGSYCSGRPLPMPLREKIVELAKQGLKPCQISKQLRVSHGCVSKLLTRWRRTGSIQPERIGGSVPKKVLPYVAAAIKVYKRLRPNIQTWQIRQRLIVDRLCTTQNVPSISSINKCLKTDVSVQIQQASRPNHQHLTVDKTSAITHPSRINLGNYSYCTDQPYQNYSPWNETPTYSNTNEKVPSNGLTLSGNGAVNGSSYLICRSAEQTKNDIDFGRQSDGRLNFNDQSENFYSNVIQYGQKQNYEACSLESEHQDKFSRAMNPELYADQLSMEGSNDEIYVMGV